jgi:hypothetical protein
LSRTSSSCLCQTPLKLIMRSLSASVLSRQVLPLLVAAMALLAFALGYFSSLSAVFDFFAQFSAHWLLLAVVAVAASFATRCAYTILALSLLIATVTPLIVTSWHRVSSAAITSIAAPALGDAPISAPEDSESRRKFKLLTFNTYNLIMI